MGIARNDPCPCGSGRKFKQCCINRQPSMPSSPRPGMQQMLESAMRHFNAGQWREAEAACQQVLRLQPKQPDAWLVMGGIALKLGHYALAEERLWQAQRLTSQCPAALWHALAMAEHAQGKLELAERHYGDALRRDDRLYEAYLNLGTILQVKEQLDKAEDCYRRCLALVPDQAMAHVNLGVVLMQLHRMPSALHHLLQAIRLNPMDATAHRNLGLVHMDQGRLQEAESCFRKSLQLNADDSVAVSNLLFSLNYRDDLSPAEKLQEARYGGELLAAMARHRGAPSFSSWKASATANPLRVGLLSGDFCQHPVAYFLESTLSHVDPTSIELIAYDTFPKDDEVSRRLKPMFSSWVSLHGMSDAQAVERIYQDSIHILIDLAGHTAHNRLPLLTCRPAPLQMAWLGYFATTGLPGLDYILVDEHVVPRVEAVQFSEQCVWLPDTYRCFTPPQSVVDVSPLPSASGQPFRFGCFNNLSKINERVVKVWSCILERMPAARIFFKASQLAMDEAQTEFRNYLRELGVDITRVDLEGPSDRNTYLRAYHRVDMTLDPFPYTGGTVSMESLWMGVPVLTRAGHDLLSRSGENLLKNVGLHDWIARDDEDYIDRAAMLATKSSELAVIRATLRDKLLASPLCDAERFARNWQNTLHQLWRSHMAQ